MEKIKLYWEFLREEEDPLAALGGGEEKSLPRKSKKSGSRKSTKSTWTTNLII